VGQDGAVSPLRSRLRTSSAARYLLAGHLAGACIAEICLLRAAARIREIDAHDGALRLVDFFPTIVTDKSRYASH
jgi:hypothetical protein